MVNGSFSGLQLWACDFVLCLFQPDGPTVLCSVPTEAEEEKEAPRWNLQG